jgi:preprotein translocase subunit SecF
MVNFLKWRWVYFLISSFVITVGLYSLFRFGYYYSIDFTGGTNIEYSINKKLIEKDIRSIVEANKVRINYLKIENKKITLRTSVLEKETVDKIKNEIEKKTKTQLTLIKLETVGPLIGREMVRKTIIASVLAIVGILVFMAFAFSGFNYAISAILAMIHDALVLFGTYSLLSYFFGAEFDTMFVTAVLTTMSFSVHDTIVIFDKIREYMKEEGKSNIEFYVNRALTETMVRSINNSMTIVFMLLALILFGGSTIRFFVVALLIGTITGTYSSPFVATPILVWLEKRKSRSKNVKSL